MIATAKPRRSPSTRAATRTRKKRLITPDDLLRFVFVSDPRMSPDGGQVLFGRKHIGEKQKYIINLWVVPARGGDPRQFTNGENDRLGRWSNDGSQIAFVRSDRDSGKAQVYLMSASGGEAAQRTDLPEGSISALQWAPNGRFLAVAFRPTEQNFTKEAEKSRKGSSASTPPRITEDIWYRLDGDGYFGAARYGLYVVDVKTGDTRLIFDRDTLGFFTFDISPDSRTIAVSANPARNALFKPWNARIYLVNVTSGKTKTVPNMPDGPKANLQWSPDGTRLAYAGRQGDDSEYSTENLHLYVCDARRGKAKNLTAAEDYCLMAITLSDTADAEFGPNFCWHPKGSRVFMRIGWHGESHICSVSAKGGKVHFHTKGHFEYALGDFSADGGTLALTRATSIEPPEIGCAMVSARSFSARVLTRFNAPLLNELELARPASHWVKSEDGARVQVWSLRPPRGKKTKLPTVLEIHGGPHAQYGVPFFHEFQVLAAAGYAVFYSNPRGSKGYGRDFCHAIHGTWGDRDWVDLQAVIRFMKDCDWVDRKRMGVMGGSYGGYMTNWVIGHTREFAGAITDRCVSNLISMWGNSDFPARPDRYWKGNAWDDTEAIWQSSPMRVLGNARTPTLIIHSEGDLRCNIEQSEQVFTVLRTHNVPARFVRYPSSTSHGLSRMGPPDLRLHRLHEILNWWKRWLR